MRVNLPVTQQQFPIPAGSLLVSTTDEQGRITHCNRAFVEVSGYEYDELIHQPHNLIRHPDMPPEAFKDMWSTIGRGRPWSGVVKNRRKNGDHYWVMAHVVPIMKNGKPTGYMSVREEASPEDVRAAEALYAQITQGRETGRHRLKLHAGRVRYLGPRDLPNLLHRLTLTQRLAAGLGAVVVCMLGASALVPAAPIWAAAATAALGSAVVVTWFHQSVQRRMDDAEQFANDLAGCNLASSIDQVHPHPLSGLTRALSHIQMNLRAVIGDARAEVAGTTDSIGEIARGSKDLSERTEAQASAVQRTAASMEQMAGTVQQTAQTAAQVQRQSLDTASAATQGGEAMTRVGTTISSIDEASHKVASIVQIIESLAFQTNILALNAAVEAARAGEQGRGFAVVAGEVRALARRSGEAATEIRALIGRSVEQVEQGTRQVADANQTIHRTVAEVQRVGEMIREISAATAEQSTGLSEVNTAVADLEQMTQANAALVEQTAAAVEVLHHRTDALRRSVQVFNF
ncbi:PAS domain-containing protein [Ideonella sp. B7]|uniref:methyl-accepting chemotaxis protein n=1 Tax=Ideonella benzenivorans TaxID=2831643 RepID=UPI001CECC4FA|nr:methyl-accepting chemotaxis protein [Ideonella benzenivorans]MCA6216360.1 PAS domain-containing protein [Ideonella benzenivorans]